MIHKLKIKTKLLIAFLVVGLAPLALVTVMALNKAGQALEGEATAKFTAIQEAKLAHIESYFKQIQGALKITRDDPYFHMAVLNLSDAYRMNLGSIDNDAWRTLADQYDPRMKSVVELNGWYDLFLINEDGAIVYTVAKESDLGMKIPSSELNDTGLGKAYAKLSTAIGDTTIVVSDFEPYAPSNNVQAGFMMAKLISGGGQLMGYVALQIPTGQINAIAQRRTGMGETGESYLVGSLNGVTRLRSDQVVFSGKIGDKITNQFAEMALKGQSGSNTMEGDFGRMFVRYDPLQILGLAWCMISTASVDEMLTMVSGLRNAIFMLTAVVFVVVAVFALWVTSVIVWPIRKVVAMLKDVAQGEGDLTKRLDVHSRGEIGQMCQWFNTFMEKLQALIKEIVQESGTLNEASTNLSGIAGQLSNGADEMLGRSQGVAGAAEKMSSNMNSVANASEEAATNVHIVATGTEEMTATVLEIARSSEKAREITGSAVSQAESASTKVGELGRAADEISKVTEVITEISEQTNLLALNATIEAARAGDAGKGFAVVANEIKELAKQTADATQEIKARIEGIQGSTSETVTEIGQISHVINQVSDIVSTIASAVEEQAVNSQEISGNVSKAAQGIQEVNENVSQSSMVSDNISSDINEVDQSVKAISNSSDEVNLSAEGLIQFADKLQGLVGRFKI